jgi:protoporphyrinogen oxidase
MLGMTLALRLARQGRRVTVFEAAPAPGGLAATHAIGGRVWDRFYHVVLPADAELRALLDEIGLGDALRWRTTRTGFYAEGRLHSVSNSVEFLRFPYLALADKVRLAATMLYASRVRDWRRLEAVPVLDWLTRLSGRRTATRFWLPLLRSKLGDNYRHTSASFIWATIQRLYGARQSGLKRELFGHVEGGYARVLGRLAERLAAAGVELRCGSAVAEVRDAGAGAEVALAGGERLRFDDVVLTVPAGRTAALAPQLTPAERDRLRGVTYQGIVCASVLLRRPLAGFYVTNLADASLPFTGVIEMTAVVDPAHFGGHALVYLPRYVTQDDPYWALDDAEVEARFLDALARMYPDFRRGDVVEVRVARAREVLALPTLHYSERWLPATRTSLPRVFVVNSAQIAAGTLNVNETVRLAEGKAVELAPLLHPAGASAPRPDPATAVAGRPAAAAAT